MRNLPQCGVIARMMLNPRRAASPRNAGHVDHVVHWNDPGAGLAHVGSADCRRVHENAAVRSDVGLAADLRVDC